MVLTIEIKACCENVLAQNARFHCVLNKSHNLPKEKVPHPPPHIYNGNKASMRLVRHFKVTGLAEGGGLQPCPLGNEESSTGVNFVALSVLAGSMFALCQAFSCFFVGLMKSCKLEPTFSDILDYFDCLVVRCALAFDRSKFAMNCLKIIETIITFRRHSQHWYMA